MEKGSRITGNIVGGTGSLNGITGYLHFTWSHVVCAGKCETGIGGFSKDVKGRIRSHEPCLHEHDSSVRELVRGLKITIDSLMPKHAVEQGEKAMWIIELLVVLFFIWLGARLGSIGIGFAGGFGVLVLVSFSV